MRKLTTTSILNDDELAILANGIHQLVGGECQMVGTLEKLGFISRTPGQGRSIELRLSREQLPDLE